MPLANIIKFNPMSFNRYPKWAIKLLGYIILFSYLAFYLYNVFGFFRTILQL